MKTSSAKAKGRKLQQRVRDAILETFTDLTTDDVRSTSMGSSGVDILLSSLAKNRFPFSVECKSLARHAIYSLFEQSVSNTSPNTYPLLVLKVNNKNPLAVIDFEHFMKLVGDKNRDQKSSGD